MRRSGLKSHRAATHREVAQVLDLAEKAFYERLRKLVFPPATAWVVVYFVGVFYLFGQVSWWHSLLVVLLDSLILLPVVAGVYARAAWIQGIEPLQHVQVACPLCARRTERQEFLPHLSGSHPSAARLANLSRSGGTVLILAALIAPLTIDNLVLVGWLSDSYLTFAEVLLFAMALVFVFWVIVVGKVLWERHVKSLSTVV